MEWPIWWGSISDNIEFKSILDIEQAPLSTGIPELDFSLKGGFFPGEIYEIVGEAGSGKTNLSLEFLKNFSKQYYCYYLSTQKPISQSRLASIEINLEKVYIRHSSSIEQSFFYINQEIPQILSENKELKLIILDNIASLVQDLPLEDYKTKSNICCGVAIVLKYLSFTYSAAIIVINNVVSDMHGGVIPCLKLN